MAETRSEVIWAQTSTPPELIGWTQLGVMGLFILAFLTGWVVSKSTHERALHDLDRLTDRLDRNDAYLRDVVVPAFMKTTEALADHTEVLREEAWRRNKGA